MLQLCTEACKSILGNCEAFECVFKSNLELGRCGNAEICKKLALGSK